MIIFAEVFRDWHSAMFFCNFCHQRMKWQTASKTAFTTSENVLKAQVKHIHFLHYKIKICLCSALKQPRIAVCLVVISRCNWRCRHLSSVRHSYRYVYRVSDEEEGWRLLHSRARGKEKLPVGYLHQGGATGSRILCLAVLLRSSCSVCISAMFIYLLNVVWIFSCTMLILLLMSLQLKIESN